MSLQENQSISSNVLLLLESKPNPKALQSVKVHHTLNAVDKNIIPIEEIREFLGNMLVGYTHQKSETQIKFFPKTKKLTIRRGVPKNTQEKASIISGQTKRLKIKKQPSKMVPLDVRISNDLVQKLKEYQESSMEISISPYYLHNRAYFQQSIMRLLEKYRLLQKNASEETCDAPTKAVTEMFSPMNHQNFVKDYLNKTTPYRGLLLFHGLGSGKTCTSIGIIEGLKHDKKIFVLTPASLQQNYVSQMQFCGDKIYNSNQHWYFYRLGNTKQEIQETKEQEVNHLSKTLHLSRSYIINKRGVWLMDSTKAPNMHNLEKDETDHIKEQIELSIKRRYTFLSYNGKLTRADFFNKFTENGNPFDHSVVCIDEAHNVVSSIVNRLKDDSTNAMRLYDLLMDAEDCKIILLSGTPLINYPNEIAVMTNILRGYIKTFKISVESEGAPVDKQYVVKLFKPYDFVDYVDYESSGSHGIISVTKTPFGFSQQSNLESGEYHGVSYDDDKRSNLTIKKFRERILKILSSAKVRPSDKNSKKKFIIKKVELIKHKNLPDDLETFEQEFLHKERIHKDVSGAAENASSSAADSMTTTTMSVAPMVRQKTKLQQRMVGIISYLGDKENLMPTLSDMTIVKVPMSDYQAPVYAKFREEELKSEGKGGSRKNDLYKKTKSSYRVYSRVSCNFVFPKEIERPILKMKKGKEIDEDFMDIVDESVTQSNLEGKYDEPSEELPEPEDESLLIYYEKIKIALEKLQEKSSEYLTPRSLVQYSPKFLSILENITNEENVSTHLLYSQFRTLEGIAVFKMILEENGFVELALRKDESGQYVLNIPPEKLNHPKFALYTGTEDSEEREIVRNIFNNDWKDLPKSVLEQVETLPQNEFGQVCKLLMITASGAEGINLKNVRYVHIMEPYWHPVRVEQVIGRARRICSHKDLPKELQTIEPFIYISVFSEQQKANKEFKSLIKNDKNMTSDEKLFFIMERKHKVNQSLLSVLKEVSIDCTLNMNASGTHACFRIPEVSRSDVFMTKPDYKERAGESKTVIKKTKSSKFMEYEVNGERVAIDREKFEKDETINVIGKIVIDDGKRKIKRTKQKIKINPTNSSS